MKQVCLTLGWSSVVFALCLLKERKSKKRKRETYSHPKMTFTILKRPFSDHPLSILAWPFTWASQKLLDSQSFGVGVLARQYLIYTTPLGRQVPLWMARLNFTSNIQVRRSGLLKGKTWQKNAKHPQKAFQSFLTNRPIWILNRNQFTNHSPLNSKVLQSTLQSRCYNCR